MLKKLIKINGLTLTELLVSSFLMGIVMVGIAGFSVTLKKMHDTTDKAAILAMQTTAAMTFMQRNFSEMIGDINNPGFVVDTSNPETSYSFRLDPNNTPDNYTDDVWAIVYSANNGANRFDLRGCFQPEGGSPGEGPDPDNGQTPCGLNAFVLLDTKMVSLTVTDPYDGAILNPSSTVLDFYSDITITTRHIPSSSADPLDNPEYTLTTRISFSQSSAN